MKKTSANAKQFLADQFPELSGKWKRTSKRKQPDGLWIREFEHESGARVALVEKDEGFAVEAATSPPDDRVSQMKLFGEEEIIGARALLDQFRAGIHNRSEDDDGESEHDLMRAKFAHALPAILSFFFPADTYDNPEAKKLNSNVRAQGLWVTFFETDKGVDDGYQYYYQWMIQDFTPELSMGDETNFQISDFDGTVAQFVAHMQSQGYTHAREECLFGRAKMATDVNRQARVDRVDFSLRKQALEVLGRDDGLAMEGLLDAGLRWDYKFGNGQTLVSAAIEQNAKSCFDVISPRIDALDRDTEIHAWAHFGQGKVEPEDYYLPMLSQRWEYRTLGESVVRDALRVAMDPLGRIVTGAMLDIASKRGTEEEFGRDLLLAVVSYPLSLRAPAVKQHFVRVVENHPELLVNEHTSPIGAMIKQRRYGMAGDWIMRYHLPAAALKVDGAGLVDVLEKRLQEARERLIVRHASPLRVVRMDRNGQAMPENEDVDARDIPGLLSRLTKPSRTPTRPR